MPAAAPQINGQDVVTLQRKATQNGAAPEFLSATVIPGRGMNLFQITANLPGKGTTNIFFAPSLSEAQTKLTGTDADKFGNASFAFGGAFLVPYPNRIRGKLSDDKQTHHHLMARQDADAARELLRQEAGRGAALDPRADPHLEDG